MRALGGLLLLAGAALAAEYRVVDLTAEFAGYRAAAQGLDDAGRAAAWDRLLEAKHRAFFDDALYRGRRARPAGSTRRTA